MEEPEEDSPIDAKEPGITSKSIEHATDPSLLSSHAGELSVGAVVEIRPHQQQHPGDVVPDVVKDEHHSSHYTEKDGQDSHHIGMHIESIEEERPLISNGTCEDDVEPFLGVLRLPSGLYLFFMLILVIHFS